MKSCGKWLALAFVLALVCLRPLSAAEFKVAVVDVNKVFAEYYRVAETEEEFTLFQEEQVAELEKERDALAALETRLQTQQPLLSEQEKEKLQAEIQEKQRTLTRQYQQVQTTLQQKNMELVEARITEIREVIGTLGQEKGFSVVVNKEAVLYAPETADITRMVIEALNRPAHNR